MSWSFGRHLEAAAALGVVADPYQGQGTPSDPWRRADGTAPTRSASREAETARTYLESLEAPYRATLATLAADLGPMHPACRVSVLVPARSEATQIGPFLARYADQRTLAGTPIDPDLFEVTVLVNRYQDETPDTTADLAQAANGPRLHVKVATHLHHPDEKAPLTAARKLLADLALYRALQRPTWHQPLYLASEDADVTWLDPRQIAHTTHTLDTHPHLDAVRGQQDRCPWQMARHPLLVVMRRSWNFTEALAARRSLHPDRNPRYDFMWNRPNTSGWNTAFTAEVYAQIRGYSVERVFEEDMDIGEKISTLRAFERDGQLIPQVNTVGRLPTRSEGSPRRWLYWAATGIEPYQEDNDFENFFRRDHERTVKGSTEAELEDLAAPYTRLDADRATSAMQRDLDFLKDVNGDEDAGKAFSRVLAALGFGPGEATVDDGRVHIRSLTGITARLDHFARYTHLTPGPYPQTLPIGHTMITWRTGALRKETHGG